MVGPAAVDHGGEGDVRATDHGDVDVLGDLVDAGDHGLGVVGRTVAFWEEGLDGGGD